MVRSRRVLQGILLLSLWGQAGEAVAQTESRPACRNSGLELPPMLQPLMPPPLLPLPSSLLRLPPIANDDPALVTQTKAQLLAAIAVQYAAAGQMTEAKALFASAITTIQNQETPPREDFYGFTNNLRSYQIDALVKIAEPAIGSALQTEAEAALREAWQLARSLELPALQGRSLGTLALQFAQLGDWQQAEQIAQSISEPYPRTDTLRNLARLRAAENQWPAAQQLLQRAQQVNQQMTFNEEWRRLILDLARAGNLEQSLTAAQDLKDYEEYVLQDLALDLIQQQQFAVAQRVAIALPRPAPQIRLLLAIAQKAGQVGQVGVRQQLLAKVLEIVSALESPSQKTEFLGEVTAQLRADNQAERALPLLAEALPQAQAEEFCTARARSLQQLAQAYALAGQRDRAQAALAQAAEAVQGIQSKDWQREVWLDMGTTALTLSDLSQAEARFAQALQLAAGSAQQRQYVQRSIALSYAEGNRLADAIAHLDRSVQGPPPPPKGFREAGLRSIFIALLENGNAPDAIATIQQMQQTADRLWAIERVNLEFPSATTVSQTLPLINAVPQASLRASWPNTVARKLAQAGHLEEALQFAQTQSPDYSTNLLLREIAFQAADRGDRSAMLRAVYRISGGTGERLRSQLLCTDPPCPRAESILDPQQESALSEAIVRFVASGDATAVLPLARNLQIPILQAKALGAIATRFAQTDNIPDAIQLAQALSDPAVKAETLTEIAAQLLKTGNRDRALALLADAKAAASAIEAPRRRTEPLSLPVPRSRQ